MSDRNLSREQLIEELKQARKRIEELEANLQNPILDSETIHLHSLFEQAGDAIFIVSTDGHLLHANEQACLSTGYTKEELLTKNVADLDEELQSPEIVRTFFEELRGGQPRRLQSRHRRKDGSVFPVEITITLIETPSGKQIMGLARDMTSYVETEAALQSSLEQQKAIFDSSMVGIMVLHNRIITKVNQRMADMMGYEVYELEGEGPEKLHLSHENFVEFGEKHYWKLAEKEIVQREYPLRHKDGHTVWCQFSGKAFAPPDLSLGAVWIIDDITERKQVALALEKRLVALTRPLDDSESVTFHDLFNLQDIQRLQNEFSDATGVASLVIMPDGTPITETSNFTKLCSSLIRGTEKGRKNCYRSDAKIGRFNPDGPIIQPCLNLGLWDAGAAITVGGKHIASWLIGQVRDETQSEEMIRAYARKIEVDEEEAARAFQDVPSMSIERFTKVAKVLFTLANQLSSAAYQNIQQARFIASRKRVERDLKESEGRHRSLIENINEAVALHEIITDENYKPVDYVFLECNPMYEKLTHLKAEDIIGKRVLEVIPNLEKKWIEIYGKVALTGELTFFIDHSEFLDRYWEITAYSPKKNQFAVAFTDVTERVKTQEALRLSEERLNLALNATHDGVWDMNLITREGYFSPQYFRMLGYEPDELPSTDATWRSLVHPDDLEMATEAIDQHIEGKRGAFSSEFRMKMKDGGWRWVLARGQVVEWDESNKPIRMVGTHTDISERKLVEEDLRINVRRLLLAQKVAKIGNWEYDIAKDMIWGSEEAHHIFGMPFGKDSNTIQLLPMDLVEDCMPERDRIHQALVDLIEKGTPYNLEYEVIRIDNGNSQIIHAIGELEKDEHGNPVRVFGTIQNITERKKRDQALLESEERYRRLTENATDIIWRIDADGRILFINSAATEVTGHSKEELFNMGIEGYTTPQSIKDIDNAVAECLAANPPKTTYRIEVEYIHKDGHTIPCEAVVTMLLDDNGQPIYFEGISRDITERKQAEEEIRKFRIITDRAVTGSVIADLQGILLYVNEYFAKVHGYTPEELLGKNLRIFHSEAQMVSVMDSVNSMINEGSFNTLELWHVHKDGTEFPMLMNGIRVDDEQGAPAYIAATGIDITDRKRAEERYRIINDASHDFIYSYDTNLRFSSANKSLCETHDLTEEEFIGKTHADLGFPKEMCDEWDGFLREVFETDRVVKRNTSVVRPDGKTYHYELRLNPLHDQNGEQVGISASARDITDRIEAEQEKQRIEFQLQQAQKMESIGRLAGGVAHDFNNLLTGITGNVSLALMDLSESDSLNETLGEISKAAYSAASLTRQLLAFSRKQIINPKVLDLNELIDDMQKMLVRLIGEDIQLRTIQKKDSCRIKADPGQIEQVLVNLAINARDAMPEGGKLTLETKSVMLDEEYCKGYPSLNPGDYIMLAISDNGEGMDEETKSKIFDPFFTTKREGKGTGLGLATAYGIIKQHDGLIDVYSEIGNGTTFKLYFPEVEQKADKLTRTHTLGEIPRGDESVLIVEDESMVRNIAIRILTRQGYKVYHASSGDEALAMVENEQVRIDLLLTDIVMPNMNGRELSERLTADMPDLKVLFTSGYTEDVIAHHGVLDEGLNFIGKPYTPQLLAKKVREILDN